MGQETTHSSPAAEAQAGESVSIHLDPAQTKVDFTAGTLRHVHGTFQLKGGIFALDGQTGVADGEILVDAESEKSNDASIGKKLREACPRRTEPRI
jgi:polyisoprenoid-binding protein YceI